MSRSQNVKHSEKQLNNANLRKEDYLKPQGENMLNTTKEWVNTTRQRVVQLILKLTLISEHSQLKTKKGVPGPNCD